MLRVLRQYFIKTFIPLLCTFPFLASAETSLLVAIAGGSGSGKTTLAQQIHRSLEEDVLIVSQDSYYKDLSHLPLEEREKTNFDHPDAIDFTLMHEQLNQLASGKSIAKPIYDFSIHSRSGSEEVHSKRIIVVEGILVLAIPEIREMMDIKIFVDTDDDIRLLRRIERDIKERGRTLEGVHKQYIATVRPMHLKFVQASKRYADVIIPAEEPNPTALSMVLSQLKPVNLVEHTELQRDEEFASDFRAPGFRG
jgi:uridine kinase